MSLQPERRAYMLDQNKRALLLPTRLVVGAQRIHSTTGGQFDHVNPATGQVQRTLALAGRQEIDLAVEAARSAFEEWRRWRPVERRRVLMKFASLMREHIEELATIQVLEIGLPSAFSAWMVQMGIDYLEDAACWADRLHGDALPLINENIFNYTSLEPIGVAGLITSWNGSVPAFGMTAGPSLAAGCTIVVKPSEVAPFGPIRCAELALEAGIPPGVINIVPGNAEAGEALVSHPDVKKIAFTGSAATARRISTTCAQFLKPCLFELGGKSARIVFPDANLSTAVSMVSKVAIGSGQQCTLGSRLLVHAGIYEEFSDLLLNGLEAIKIGDPFKPDTMMGPVANEAACNRILGLIDRARSYGAVRTGGERLKGDLAGGFFIPPTLIDEVDNQTEIARTEAFGPVFAMIPFTDEDEAIAIANDSDLGLAGYVHTDNLGRAHRVAARLDTGNVGINGAFIPAGPSMPFGGRKTSGYGKQGGRAAVMEFLHIKTVQATLD